MTTTDHLAALPPEITVVAYPDPLVEAIGFGPCSAYVEHVWLPVLGPSCTWLYRALGRLVVGAEDGAELTLPIIEVMRGIGLGEGTARNSIAARTVARLVDYDACRRNGRILAVRRALPA